MQQDKWILIRGARQLLTLHRQTGARRGAELAELGLIVDGSVLLRNGIIEAVGPTRRIENMSGAKNAEEIDAVGRVVMPAFIDAHACVVPVPAHGSPTTRSVQALPATRLEAQADELLKLMARHGTATTSALSGHGGDASGELKILRALHARHKKPLDVVSILLLHDTNHSEEATLELLNCVARRKLATIAAILCGDGGINQTLAGTLLRTARDLGLGLRVELLPKRGSEAVEMAVQLGAGSVAAPGPYRIPEIEMLRGSSTVAILLPQLLARTGSPGLARGLIESGVLIALGSGMNPAGGATASMQTVIQLACELLGLSLPEAISAATVNAAWALGLGPRTGTLEHGKSGDVILLDASDYREIPLLAGTNLIHSVLKRGVVLFKEEFPGWQTAA